MALKLFRFGKFPCLGIDISDSSIKLVSLSNNKSSHRLEAYARVSLPKNAVVEKEIKDIEVVATCLREAVFLSQSVAKHGAVALSDSSVMTKIIEIEKELPASEFEEQVMFEASKHIPYPLDEIRLDYQAMENLNSNTATMPVLIAASRSETVDAYLQVLEKANITPKLIEIESFAMRKSCMNYIEEFQNTTITAVIDIGTIRTTIVIYQWGMPVFTRTELFGMKFLTKDISADKLDLLDNVNQENSAVYESFKKNLIQYLKRALQFYSSTSDARTIEKIVLTGATAKLKNLDELLEAEFNYEVIVADPVSKLIHSSNINANIISQASSGLMIAIGLALRSFD